MARVGSVLMPVGGALFEKGADSLGCVLDHHVLDHHRACMGIGLIEAHFDLVVKGAFADPHGGAELAGDLARQGVGFGGEVFMGDGAVDESERRGAVGVDEIAGGQHLEGLFARDVAAERHHRGRAEQADIDAVDAKARAVGSHGKVAGGDELAAGGGGDAVRLGDDRLGQGADCRHHSCAAGEEIGEIGAPAILGLAPGGHLLEIMPGAEGLAGAVDDDHADRAVTGEAVELILQGGQHRVAERIELLGVVEGQPGDGAVIAALENCHLEPPVSLWATLRAYGQGGKRMSLKMTRAALEDFLAAEFPQVAGDFEIEELGENRIRVRLATADRHLRPGGTVSGPSMFALADVSVYLAILAMIGPEALAVTTNCSIDFMRKPAAGADLIAECRILKLGRVLAVGEVLIFSLGVDAPVARASLTYSIPPARE